MAATLLLLTGGCTDRNEPTPNGGATATSRPPATGSRAGCTDLTHGGQRLGVTTPETWSVVSPPDAGDAFSRAYDVRLLEQLELRRAGERGPDAVVLVYGHVKGGEPRRSDPLTAAILNTENYVLGSGIRTPVTATPTSVAGVPGSAGGTVDPQALDGDPSPMRWWSLPVDDVRFVVVMAARDADLDRRYSPQVVDGLHVGGCPEA